MTLAIILSIIFEILLLTTSFLAYQKGMKKKFDVLSEFPYELMDKNSNLALVTRLTFIFFFVTLSPWLYFQLEMASTSETLSAMGWFVLASFAIFIALFIAISMTNPAYEKAHNFYFVGASGFLTISAGLEGTYILRISSSAGSDLTSILLTVTAVFCFLVALAALITLVNPKLKNWPKLDAVAETDGTISYKRPRPFILALSEWVLLLLAFVFSLFASASLLIMSLSSI